MTVSCKGFILSVVLCAAAIQAQDTASTQTVAVLVGGKIVSGELLSHSDTEFSIKVNGAPIVLRWDSLDPAERQRLQKICGISAAAPKPLGRELAGVALTLKSGKVVRGLWVPEQQRVGQKALRSEGQLLYIPESEIVSAVEFKGRESDFFTPLEIYERLLTQRPPGTDAVAHLELATTAEELGLPEKALLHLQTAGSLDERTAVRHKDTLQRLSARIAEQQGNALFDQMLRARAAGNYASALEKINLLEKGFPSSELRSRWTALKPDIEKRAAEAPDKQIVLMAYQTACDVLARRLSSKVRVDQDGNRIPSIPGKQILTRQGTVLRGTLQSADPAGNTIIMKQDTQITIPTKEIAGMQDVDLASGGKEVERSLEELQEFVADVASAGGLKGLTLARISEVLRLKEEKVRTVFDNRLKKEATYEGGKLISAPLYAIEHSVSYGAGSWLRPGARFTPYRPPAPNPNAGSSAPPAPDPDASASTSDKPDVWWSFQKPEVKLEILRAFMAEKMFKVKSIESVRCRECGGIGTLPKPLNSLEPAPRCPTCRGLKASTRVLYE